MTLALHESNAQQAGQAEQVASWKAYSEYLTGLVEQVRAGGPGGAAAEGPLKAGVAQVPPRPQARAMNAGI